MLEGEFGNTANVAASPQESSLEGLPKYLHDAASRPTTFPPYGAWEAYNARILFLEYLSSRRVASMDSTNFWKIVLSLPLDILITCMVMVLPPLVTCPALMLPTAALTMDTGLIPGCQ